MAITTAKKSIWPIAVLDAIALGMVYFVPAISHLTSIPFYIIEPLRIMVLISLVVFGSKRNALLLAITLPLFSFAIAAHPVLVKSILISVELIINVLAYTLMVKKFGAPFWPLLITIMVSKLAYYLMKYIFISVGFLSSSLVSTPLMTQFIVAILTTIVFYFLHKLSVKA